jgi:hypothetical protein
MISLKISNGFKCHHSHIRATKLAAHNDDPFPEVLSHHSDRYRFLNAMTKLTAVVLSPHIASIVITQPAEAAAPGTDLTLFQQRARDDIKIPLTTYDGVLCVTYCVNNNQYRAIADTGSPFLIVPSVDTRTWGYTSKDSKPYLESGLSKTTEIFGGQDYESYWRVGDLNLNNYLLTSVVFAHVGEDIMRPPGGVFFGLIKYKAKDIRPTLLGQMKYSSILFDSLNKELILSRNPLITTSETKAAAIKMVDLRSLGDPVYHYAARIKSLELNGREIARDSVIYAVFDTGTTGCVLSDDLMNDYETPNPIRNVRMIITAENGQDIIIESAATREEIFVVTAAKIPWFTKESDRLNNYFDDTTVEVTNKLETNRVNSEEEDDAIISANISRRLKEEPQVVVVGLTFFKNKVLLIDIDEGRLSLIPAKAKV